MEFELVAPARQSNKKQTIEAKFYLNRMSLGWQGHSQRIKVTKVLHCPFFFFVAFAFPTFLPLLPPFFPLPDLILL